MKKKVLLASSLLISLVGYAQTVKGRVVQKDIPVPNASILLKKGDKEMTAITDEQGVFVVNLTEGGDYVMKISGEGINPADNQIFVGSNSTLDLGDVFVSVMTTSTVPMVAITETPEQIPPVEEPVMAKTEPQEPTKEPQEPTDEKDGDEKVATLQTVELIGRARRDYNSDYSFSSSKIALKNMEVAQSISSVTKELLSDRQVTRLGDALKNVSGVNQTSFYNLYSIRGVTQASGYRENRLINGMATSLYFFSQPLTMNLERVEVIKGPASMTFSSTDPGGSINMVTKKPLSTNRKEASLSVGSYGTIIGAIDFTGPLNKDKSLLYRLNVGYENSGSFRDLQFKKAYMIAPTITYIPNEKTRVNVEMVLTDNNNRLDRGQPIFFSGGQAPALNSTPINYAIGAVNDHNKTLDINLMGNLTHKFTENIGLNLSYMKHIWQEDLVELRTNNNFGKDVNGTRQPYWVEMRYVQRQQKFLTDNINAYFNADWNIGEVKNKSVFGYDFIAFEVSNAGGTNTVRDYNADGTPRIPHWDLRIKDGSQYKVMYPGFYQPQARRITPVVPMYYNTNAAYVMNQMEWNKFIFNFGLRQEWYTDKNYYKTEKENVVKQDKLLLRAGLMYKATKNINAYASYVEGFQMQTDAYLGSDTFRINGSTGLIEREPFSPKTSKMIEGGVKTEWMNGKLHANLAYYNIKQNNVLTYADGKGYADELSDEGATERNQGVELEVMGRITPNWMVNAGYAYIDANLTKYDRTLNQDVTYRKDNAPKHSFNIWTRYDIKEGVFKNFGFGVGVNYVDEKISWQERDLVLPDYTIVDAAVYYKLKSMQIAFNVNNVFNRTYWLGAFNYPRLFPGTPRNIMLNVKYSF